MKLSSLKNISVAGCSLFAAALLFAPLPVFAQTAAATMPVSATVTASCTITATAMAFAAYTNIAITSTATVTPTCSNTTPYNVGLDVGTATGATVTTRGMFVTGTPGVVLNYGLYSDAGFATVWGPTVGTNTVAGTGSGTAQALTVYGQVLGGQLVAPGAYTDTITATVTY